MLQTALEYLDRGWSVIPLEPHGKKPLIRWQDFQTRQATPKEVNQWFTQWPDANLGVVTGKISGLVVLDVDGPEGEKSLSGKQLSPTLCAKTGKGLHYYYKHPGDEVTGTIRVLDGLDIRADGNYVVAPPSIHSSGVEYEWTITGSAEEMPDWLASLVKPKAEKGSGEQAILDSINTEWFVEALAGSKEGERNKLAAKLCGRWLGLGLSPEEVRVFLLDWNKRNNPPAPEAELVATLSSITKLETAKKTAELNGMQPITPDSVIDPATACESLSNTFGVKITRITRYKGDPPSFTIHLEGEELDLSGIEELILQGRFRNFLARHKSIQFSKRTEPAWDAIWAYMMKAITDVEVGEEGKDAGILKSQIRHYLRQNKPVEIDIDGDRPFLLAGKTYIISLHFNQNIDRAQLDKHGRKAVSKLLRQIGCLYVTKRPKGRDGKPKAIRCWEVPKQLLEAINDNDTDQREEDLRAAGNGQDDVSEQADRESSGDAWI